MSAHDKIGKAAKSLFGGVRMDGSQRSGMARIKGIEQSSRLNSAHLAQDDPVRIEPESVLQEAVE